VEENNLVNYEGIDLLIKILNKSDKDNKVKKNIENLDNIVNTKFKKLLNFSNILPANIFFDIQNLNLDLKEFSIYPKIFGKNIIGVGGCFSSGKSAFINSILEERILPIDTIITTSFPTYILNETINRNILLTSFQEMLEVDKLDLKKLSHRFYEEYGVHLSTVVDKIFIENNSFDYENLALLDTPGYNADSDSGKKDMEISYSQLRRLKYIIWIIDINNGGLRNDDLDFINSLGKDKEIFFVINKADTVSDEKARYDVYQHIQNQIENEKFNSLGVALYSSRTSKNKEKRTYPGNDVRKFLAQINALKNINFLEDIGNRFKKIINEIDKILADSQDRSDKLISTVNQYDAAMYKLEEYSKKYSSDDLIKIINDEKEKKGNIRELEKLVNDFIIEYVNELQDLFKNIETEFELGKGKLSNYIKNINLENIRVKLEVSKTGDFIKVSSAENQKNNFVFEERQEKISPKIEEKAQSNINIVKNEEKSIPKKKVIKQELSKDKFIIELKKILKEN
jgi:GTP-binding protein HSR1-related protein